MAILSIIWLRDDIRRLSISNTCYECRIYSFHPTSTCCLLFSEQPFLYDLLKVMLEIVSIGFKWFIHCHQNDCMMLQHDIFIYSSMFCYSKPSSLSNTCNIFKNSLIFKCKWNGCLCNNTEWSNHINDMYLLLELQNFMVDQMFHFDLQFKVTSFHSNYE